MSSSPSPSHVPTPPQGNATPRRASPAASGLLEEIAIYEKDLGHLTKSLEGSRVGAQQSVSYHQRLVQEGTEAQRQQLLGATPVIGLYYSARSLWSGDFAKVANLPSAQEALRAENENLARATEQQKSLATAQSRLEEAKKLLASGKTAEAEHAFSQVREMKLFEKAKEEFNRTRLANEKSSNSFAKSARLLERTQVVAETVRDGSAMAAAIATAPASGVVGATIAATAVGTSVHALGEGAHVSQGLKSGEEALHTVVSRAGESAVTGVTTGLGLKTSTAVAGQTARILGQGALTRLTSGAAGSIAFSQVQTAASVVQGQELNAQDYVIDSATGAIAGAFGAQAGAIREEAKTLLKKGLVLGVELTGDVGLGVLSAGGKAQARGAELTFAEIVGEVHNSVVGSTVGEISTADTAKQHAPEKPPAQNRPFSWLGEISTPAAVTPEGLRIPVPTENESTSFHAPLEARKVDPEQKPSGSEFESKPAKREERAESSRTKDTAPLSDEKRKELDRASRRELESVLADRGLLDSSNPIAVYLGEIQERITAAAGIVPGDPHYPRAHVLGTRGEVNAAALPDGSIVYSPDLARVMKTEDELAAVAVHETMHLWNKDHESIRSAVENTTSALGANKAYAARSRMAEYEGDLTGLMSNILSDAGYNPVALDSMLERLRNASESGRAWDVEHGALFDRRLNALWLAQSLDLLGSDKAQKPIPDSIRQAYDELPTQAARAETIREIGDGEMSGFSAVDARLRSGEIAMGDLGLALNVLERTANNIYLDLEARSSIGTATGSDVVRLGRRLQVSRTSDFARHAAPFIAVAESVAAYVAREFSNPEEQAIAMLLIFENRTNYSALETQEIRGREVRVGDAIDFRLADGSSFFGTLSSALESGIEPILRVLQSEPFESPRLGQALISSRDRLGTVVDIVSRSYQIGNYSRYDEATDRDVVDAPRLVSDLRSIHAALRPEETARMRERFVQNKLELMVESGNREHIAKVLPEFGKKSEVAPVESGRSPDDPILPPPLTSSIDPQSMVDWSDHAARAWIKRGPSAEAEISEHLSMLSPAEQLLVIRGFAESVIQSSGSQGTRFISDEGKSAPLATEYLETLKRLTMQVPPSVALNSAMMESVAGYVLEASVGKFASIDNFADYVNALDGSARQFGSKARIEREKTVTLDSAVREIIAEAALLATEPGSRQTILEALRQLDDSVGIDITDAILSVRRERSADSSDASQLQRLLDNKESTEKLVRELWGFSDAPEDRLLLTKLLPDRDLANRLMAQISEQLHSEADYETLRRVLFDARALSGQAQMNALEVLVERAVQTPAQMREVREQLKALYRDTGESEGAALVLADLLLTEKRGDSAETLTALLQTRRDNVELQKLILTRWWNALRADGVVSGDFDVTVGEYHSGGLEAWIHDLNYDASTVGMIREGDWAADELGSGKGSIPLWLDAHPSALETRFYTATPAQRHVLARKLLAGDSESVTDAGVVFDQAKAKRVINTILDTSVRLGTEREVVDLAVDAFLEVAKPEELYFFAAPFVESTMLVPPQQSSDPLKSVLSTPVIREHVERSTGARADKILRRAERFGRASERSGSDARLHEPTPAEYLGDKIARAAYPEADTSTSDFQRELFNQLPDELKNHGGRTTPLEGSEALLEIIRLLRGPGLRGAQSAQLTIDVPEGMRQKLRTVFDNERGQSRLAMFQTVEREVPSLLSDGAILGERIGGGSQMTVYDYTAPDGAHYALKVLNPNAQYFVTQRIDLLQRTAQRFAEKLEQSGKHDEVLDAARKVRDHLLPELEEWMTADIRNENFAELDSAFRERWNGAKESRRGKFELFVPRSVETGSRFVSLDEYVDGKPLTRFSLGDKTDYAASTISRKDWSDIVALVGDHYRAQVSEGIVHSNPTPGNFMLTPDNRIAILDRSMYLQFDFQDRVLLAGMTSRWGAGLVLPRVVDRFLADEKNEGVRGDRDAIVAAARTAMNDQSGGSTADSIAAVMRALKDRGVRIPLRYNLLALNIQSIEGFSSVLNSAGGGAEQLH